ncbi:MAG: alpha/beta fold hydrolase [Planctomycetota bacterium]
MTRRAHRAERDGRSIHWSSTGMGPALILVPGLGAGIQLFGTLPRRFEREGFRALTVDPVGVEPSSPLTGTFRFEDAADDLIAVLDAAQVPSVALVGTSLGGKVALTCAVRHPDRVQALVLLASAAAVSVRARRVYRYFAAIADNVPTERFADAVAPFLFGRSFHDARPQLVDDIARAMRPTPERRALMLAQLRALESTDLADLARHVDVRTLCLAGEEDTLTCAADVETTANLIRGAEFAVVPKAGHSLLLEQPETFSRVVAFLREGTARP